MELSILETSLAILMKYFIFEVCLAIFYEIIYLESIHTLLPTYNGIFYLWSKPCYLEVHLATFHVIIYLGSLPCYLFGIFYLGIKPCYLSWNYLSWKNFLLSFKELAILPWGIPDYLVEGSLAWDPCIWGQGSEGIQRPEQSVPRRSDCELH